MTPVTQDLHSLLPWITEQRETMLHDLGEYVRIETPSDDPQALAHGRDWIRTWIGQRLGEPVSERRESGDQPYGDTLVLDYPGTGYASTGGIVTLLAHYDTVWPLGTLDSIPFTVEGDTIRGPGVFDMKAGLVQAVWAVAALRHVGLAHPPLRWVLNGDEELGSPSSRAVIEDSCRDASAVLVFEASADGAVKTARKGVGLFDVHLTGIEAHAGLDPTAGASAITALAHLIGELDRTQNLEAGTSINVGLIDGGTRRNVAAGAANAGIDVRVSDPQEATRIDDLLNQWAPPDSRVTATVTGGWNRPVMTRTPQIAALYEQARTIAVELGIDLHETSVGGASDGNFASALGVAVLDGLGAVGAGAHARHEHATVSGMLQRTVLTAGLLHRLSTAPTSAHTAP